MLQHRKMRGLIGGCALLCLAALCLSAGSAGRQLREGSTATPFAPLDVIVRERGDSPAAAQSAVRRLGGRVLRELPIVHGFSASVPARSLPALRRARGVAVVWLDAKVQLADADPVDLESLDALPPNTAWRQAIGLSAPLPSDGNGVTVALLDTGVAQVPDLEGQVAERIDLTSERDGLDHYGHGTHMAGLIAGTGAASGGEWAGVAPAARLVSVKVAGADGSTDVSVVLAGLQWIAANEERLGIRVLNLSFGTNSRQSATIDPLDYAVEQLWRSGVFVVVAAGNRGPLPETVDKPGDDPYVVTVGAGEGAGAASQFSSLGPTQDGYAKPDLLAPGTSIVSTLAPGSTIGLARPAALVGDSYIKGSGTSQAAAIVSGAAALLFEADPALTPDEAKAVLTSTATTDLPSPDAARTGFLDVGNALDVVHGGSPPAPANQGLTPSTGLGSLEASRGSSHVVADPTGSGVASPVVGEVDIFGTPWDAKTWSTSFWGPIWWDPIAWAGASWNGWDAKTWSAKTWSAAAWK